MASAEHCKRLRTEQRGIGGRSLSLTHLDSKEMAWLGCLMQKEVGKVDSPGFSDSNISYRPYLDLQAKFNGQLHPS